VNPWPFVAAAYLVTLGGAAALALANWWAMRRAEAPGTSDPAR
jgi:hypothetical protein